MTDNSSARPSAPTGRPAKPRQKIAVGQILAAVLLVLVVIFIFENTRTVKIRIIAGPEVKAPLSVALLIAAVVGAAIAFLFQLRRKHKS